MTRKSTPKHEVIDYRSGVVALSGVSKTEAAEIARAMNKGSKVKRFQVRPAKREA